MVTRNDTYANFKYSISYTDEYLKIDTKLAEMLVCSNK